MPVDISVEYTVIKVLLIKSDRRSTEVAAMSESVGSFMTIIY